MRTAIAIFVKTPPLSPVKTRLAKTIGEREALAFYHLSLKAVEATVKKTCTHAFWAVCEHEALSHSLWNGFETLHTGGGDLGRAQHHVYDTLLQTYKNVILIGADTPQLSPEIIQEAIEALQEHDFTIGPATDGGYYLFGGKKPLDERLWLSVSWSTSTTRAELENALPSPPYHLPSRTDVDTQEDLPYMLQEMPVPISPEQEALVNHVTIWTKEPNREL